jgi:hypothetical protein
VVSLVGVQAPVTVAAAATGLPRVTGVTPYLDGGNTLDDLHFNWGAYTSDTAWFVQSDSTTTWNQGTPPADMVSYANANPAAPWSYRAVVCPTGFVTQVCDPFKPPGLMQPAGATTSTVIGPWDHPTVSATISDPAPTVTAQAHIGFISGTINVEGHTDAPLNVVYRDGAPIQLLPKGQTAFSDSGPFSHDTVSYRVASCYRDCVSPSLSDGFAGRSALSTAVGVPNPIFRVAPNVVVQGLTTTVAVKGYGFVPGTTVALSGAGITVRHTRFVSATRMSVDVSVATGVTASSSNVTLTNPDGSTQSCGPCLFVIPAPQITSTNPSSVPAGYTGTVGVIGLNFQSGAKITTTGSGVTILSTGYSTWTELVAVISVTPSAMSGPVPLTVTNPDGAAAICQACLSVS